MTIFNHNPFIIVISQRRFPFTKMLSREAKRNKRPADEIEREK